MPKTKPILLVTVEEKEVCRLSLVNALGRVVRKSINANLRLNVNQGFHLAL